MDEGLVEVVRTWTWTTQPEGWVQAVLITVGIVMSAATLALFIGSLVYWADEKYSAKKEKRAAKKPFLQMLAVGAVAVSASFTLFTGFTMPPSATETRTGVDSYYEATGTIQSVTPTYYAEDEDGGTSEILEVGVRVEGIDQLLLLGSQEGIYAVLGNEGNDTTLNCVIPEEEQSSLRCSTGELSPRVPISEDCNDSIWGCSLNRSYEDVPDDAEYTAERQ